jgi:hypothetical protein
MSSSFNSFSVETKDLKGEISPTSGDHVFFNCSSGRAGENLHVTVRGIEYAASAHFYKSPEGAWTLGKEGDAPSSVFYNHLYVSRRGYYGKAEVSHSARVKIADILTAEFMRWLEGNQGALDEAQHDDTTRQIEKRLAEVAKLLEQISTLNGEIDSLREQL